MALDSTLSPGFVSLEGISVGPPRGRRSRTGGPHPTRAGLLQAVHEVGRFDISGSDRRTEDADAPPKVFLTVIQKDGSFKAVNRL